MLNRIIQTIETKPCLRYRPMLLLTIFVAAAGFSYAQTNRVASVVHMQYTIESRVLGETRTILVRVPQEYDRGDTKYPVIYMLDAHPPQNAMMAGIVEQQAWGGVMPEMIIVGIQNTDRSRDLTPTDDGKGGHAGGGAKFLEFIQSEVIPLVEKNYRTQPFRIFAGHSLGGLFAVYAFTAEPHLFNAYIAVSPVLDYDNNYVIKRAEALFKTGQKQKTTLFVGLGDEPDYIKGFNLFQDLVKRSKPDGLEYEFRQFKDEGHASVVLPGYYAGLRKIFAGWPPPGQGSLIDLESHYRGLSARYGYTILTPEPLLNRIGYQLLRTNRTTEAIDVFKKNADNYPHSANCLDSLAAAYEKNGALDSARENYEKAYKMAESNSETDLARSAKANYLRLSQKGK